MNANSRSHPDYWSKLAIQQGYPARSVFKLEEIQKKWKPMQRGKAILDIGAAPGSWSLFALRTLGRESRVTAIDLKKIIIKAPSGTTLQFLQTDIFSKEAGNFLSHNAPYGCLLSDAAPSTTGNRLVDCSRSEELVCKVLEIAGKFLSLEGNCVVKLFQGDDSDNIIKSMKTMFNDVKIFRPKAVRSDSIEIYLIGRGYGNKRINYAK